MSYLDDAMFVRKAAKKNNKFFKECLPMIASENILSPLCQEMLVTDFHGRYAEGTPGKRYYQGCKYFDDVESKAIELAKKLFNCNYANVQCTSGTVSNIAVLKALGQPGDTVAALSTDQGSHISHAKMGAVGLRGLNTINYPFNPEIMNIDVDGAVKVIREAKPKIALFGQSVYLFPTPLKEVSAAAHEVGANVMYDGAHVLGLIGGGKFQDPLHEGADVMTGSTHKTFPGPQGGIVLSDHKGDTEEDAKFLKRFESACFPGVTSSYHLHHVAAKAIALAEHLEFGAAYADQICRNARALGQAMHEMGFKILAEKLGFTRSHQIVAKIGEIGEAKGKWAAEELEKANIIVNMNMVPGDTKALYPSGIRIGVQELTRCGMKESQMAEVARLYKMVLLDGKNPKEVRKETMALRAGFDKIHYCFGEGADPYKYHRIAKI
ncbi:MAG: serine hydroxymethyltransferase, partial [Candidatus Thermoplasmatota archaeon]|nr:serine hydroxymethyltransferase [Candidatus Thermoplasmatota archaeon]